MTEDLTTDKAVGSEPAMLVRLTGAAMLMLGLLVGFLALPGGFWGSAMTAVTSLSPEKLRYLSVAGPMVAVLMAIFVGMAFVPRQTLGFVLGGVSVLGAIPPLMGWLLLFGFSIPRMQTAPGDPLMGVAALLAIGGLSALIGSIAVPEKRRTATMAILCFMLFAVGFLTAIAFEQRTGEARTMVSVGEAA